MPTVIVTYKEGTEPVSCTSLIQKVPEGAAITVTENCKGCYHIQYSLSGKKPVCTHKMIMFKRPYADDTEKGRLVNPETRPEWCPL